LTVHEVDLCLAGAAAEIVTKVTPDWVFHLAAHGAYSWQTDAAQICRVNLMATIELIDAVERTGVNAFVHAGSSSEYGFKDHPPDEHERPEPNSAYAVAKTAATMYCCHRAEAADVPVVTLRLYSVYGALEDPRRLVFVLLERGLAGELPALVSPDTARDFVYVGDVCDALIRAAARAATNAGGVYNVGSGQQTTIRELVDCVRELLDISVEPDWGSHPQRIWDTATWCANTTRIARDLQWVARTNIRDGLGRTLDSMTAGPVPRNARIRARRSGSVASAATRAFHSAR
jgi:nucleoside-diphosphate-sugar epimerase